MNATTLFCETDNAYNSMITYLRCIVIIVAVGQRTLPVSCWLLLAHLVSPCRIFFWLKRLAVDRRLLAAAHFSAQKSEQR